MGPEALLITGDFNFHINCLSGADARTFADLGTIHYLCRGVGWKNPSVNITNTYDPSQERKKMAWSL